MSAIANITVFDGAASPASHTFTPVSVTRDKQKVIALWREQLASVPTEACPRITMTLENLKSGMVKAETRVEIPVMESVSGQNAAGYTAAPKVAYVDTCVFTAWQHARSSVAGRRLVRQLLVNLGNNITTTVAASATGFLPELVDGQVAPT